MVDLQENLSVIRWELFVVWHIKAALSLSLILTLGIKPGGSSLLSMASQLTSDM